MQNPLVSIVVPFKNTKAFIEECVVSIIDQTYTNWEAIFIDDSSVDASDKIVAQYAIMDKRITVEKNSGNGIIEALRHAHSLSNGEFITRMDSDDIMMPNRIETMANALINHGPQYIALGMVDYFRKDGVRNGYERYETWLNKLTINGANFNEIYKECVIPSPCWMVYREDLDSINAFYPDRYPEDYDLAFRFYEAGFNCIPCDRVLHKWRDYEQRTSRTHEHYSQNYFLDIKLHYFLKLDHDASRPLTVWGAGNKGKSIAKSLISKNIPFFWICDNPKKIGKHIYGCELLNFEYLKALKSPQSIVTVANEQAQIEIRNYFDSQDMYPMIDYFFFC